MLLATLPERGTDDWGSGEFHASRSGGSRKHKGVDYGCLPETLIHSRTDGRVTKLGYPYSSDLSFRYVQIEDEHGARHRYFYVEPGVSLGEIVYAGDVIGEAQDIAGKYSRPDKVMKNHVHYEILVDGVGEVDPRTYAA